MSIRVGGPPSHAVELGLLLEPLCNLLEQIGSEDAVVVGEGDQLGAHLGEPDISSPRQPARRAEPPDRERVVSREDRVQSLVLVLVNHQDPESAMGLTLEGVEEAPELVDPVDGGDHEVE